MDVNDANIRIRDISDAGQPVFIPDIYFDFPIV